MLAKVMLAALGTLALSVAYVVHEGVVRVSLDEHVPGGKHVHLLVPAAAATVALAFVPDAKLRDAAAEARPWIPVLRVASEELARLPDSALVEVQNAEQRVSIVKRSALLVIDVRSPRETVHIAFPLKTLNRVARRLESLDPAL